MASGALAGSTKTAASAAASPGMNPFWTASNWYFEPQSQEILNGSYQLTGSRKNFGIQLDTNGFLKDGRTVFRSAGAVGGTAAPDGSYSLFQQTSFQAPNGSEFFKPLSGWQYLNLQAYGRPWEGDPTQWYDYASNINPSGTIKFAPEIRHTAASLQNMDSRKQYKIQGQIGAVGDVISGTNSTAPTISFNSGIDTWAQPDAYDISDVPNQAIPPGVALQIQRQVAVQQLNGASASNTIDAKSLTGDVFRLVMLEVRDSNNVRQDYLTSPISYTLDNRVLANYTLDALFGQMHDFYGIGMMPRPTGMYVFPRFYNPVNGVGLGWMDTSNATKLQWQSSTNSSAVNVPGTVSIIVEDVTPLQGLPGDLLNV